MKQKTQIEWVSHRGMLWLGRTADVAFRISIVPRAYMDPLKPGRCYRLGSSQAPTFYHQYFPTLAKAKEEAERLLRVRNQDGETNWAVYIKKMRKEEEERVRRLGK